MYDILIGKKIVKQTGVFILNLASETEIWNYIRPLIKGLLFQIISSKFLQVILLLYISVIPSMKCEKKPDHMLILFSNLTFNLRFYIDSLSTSYLIHKRLAKSHF